MDTRFYQAQGLDIQRIAIDLENMFLMQGYQVQHFGDRNHTVVQFKKGGEFAAIIGMQAALTLTLQNTPGGIMAVIGQQKWADKAAVGAVGLLILWPLAFTAGAGAIRQSNLTEQLLNALDAVVRQQQANVQIGPVPFHMLPPQVQQQMASPPPPVYAPQPPPPAYTPQPPPQPQWVPGPPPPYPPPPPVVQPPPPVQQQVRAGSKPPAPKKVECPHCHAPNDAGDMYCARCGQSLLPQKIRCPQCGASNKPGVAFCTKCGTSFTQEKRAEEPTVAVEMTPKTQLVMPNKLADKTWGYLLFANENRVELTGSRLTVGRAKPDTGDVKPDINLYDVPESSTVSRMHAVIERTQNGCTLIDLKSTNLTRINGETLVPNTPTPFEEGNTLEFGKVACTFTRG